MRAVIHADGNVHDEFAGGIAENLPDTLIQIELLCCKVEPSGLGFPGIGLLLEGKGLHGMFCFLHRGDQ